MIAHVILFRPRPDLSADEREDLWRSLRDALTHIPSIRGFRIGRRVRHGLPGYEQLMHEDFEYAAMLEFDDIEGLKAYLRHPAHVSLGLHFAGSSAAALAYDYELVDILRDELREGESR